MTMNGPLIYFVEFLAKPCWMESGWRRALSSINRRTRVQGGIVGTDLLSLLSGHRWYAWQSEASARRISRGGWRVLSLTSLAPLRYCMRWPTPTISLARPAPSRHRNTVGGDDDLFDKILNSERK